MTTDQSVYGPDANSVSGAAGAAFGRALYRLLPEDRFDAQPLRRCDGRFLIVADARLDNRDELAGLLDVGTRALAGCSDADLIGMAYERWGERIVDRIVGDYAFAVWDDAERRLFLARDPMGQRPLHFHRGDGCFAFCSMPSGLHALKVFRRTPDRWKLAEYVTSSPIEPGRSSFERIETIPSGHFAIVSPAGFRMVRWWDPPLRTLRLPKTEDYIEAFREHVDRAVRARLRGVSGSVGAHLSSGFDSSTVATTAARLQRPHGDKVVAFTAAPRNGFDGPEPRGRAADESGIAATTAAMHPNIEHVIVRSDGRSPFSLLPLLHAYAQQPAARLCNHLYWTQINQAAQTRNLTVLLTGEQGNLTLSAGGLAQLADLIRLGRWSRWLIEAPAARAKTGASWKGVLASSFGPWMPLPVWESLRRRFIGIPARASQPFLLAPELRRASEAKRRRASDTRPPGNSYAGRLEALEQADFGNRRKASLALWGIDERDPTADRRLIEFCLSLPIDQLLRDGVRRPLARAALADRLPAEVLDPRLRGVQMADWYEHVTRDELMALADRYEGSSEAAALLDFGRLRHLVERWPRSNWNEVKVIMDYRESLLHALAGAHFAEFASLPVRPAFPKPAEEASRLHAVRA